MIAILELLNMDAGVSSAAPAATAGQQCSVLETPGMVDVLREELGKQTDWHHGLSQHGTPETNYRRMFLLRWPRAFEGTLTMIEEHYRAWVAAPSTFEWVSPNTTVKINVRYSSPPIINRSGAEGGSAQVRLEEAFQIS